MTIAHRSTFHVLQNCVKLFPISISFFVCFVSKHISHDVVLITRLMFFCKKMFKWCEHWMSWQECMYKKTFSKGWNSHHDEEWFVVLCLFLFSIFQFLQQLKYLVKSYLIYPSKITVYLYSLNINNWNPLKLLSDFLYKLI